MARRSKSSAKGNSEVTAQAGLRETEFLLRKRLSWPQALRLQAQRSLPNEKNPVSERPAEQLHSGKEFAVIGLGRFGASLARRLETSDKWSPAPTALQLFYIVSVLYTRGLP